MFSHFLGSSDNERLEQLQRCDPHVREVLQQVTRILASRRFSRVQQRAKDFFGFVVAKTLLGQADQIKELTIGVTVFGKADFDPAQSSIVRVAAADLRERLGNYAEQEGHDDIILIRIPLNTYVPEILDRRVAIEISEFENWHPLGEYPHLCPAITTELVIRLTQSGFRAGPRPISQASSSQPRYMVRGSVETRDDLIRVNVSLAAAASGRIVCSRTVEGPREDVFKLAGALSDDLRAAVLADTPEPAKVRVSSRKFA